MPWQGVLPTRMTLVLGDLREEQFATARYAAYFRYVRGCLEQTLLTPPVTYPEPVDHCAVCAWFAGCDARLRTDDHLSLVAGISTRQRRALEMVPVRRVDQLATLPLARSAPVDGIGFAALTRIREQARIQVEGRLAGALRYELLPHVEEGRGLALLPEPSPGDLFLDFEGDPYALGDGLEYLLGIVELPGEDRTEPRYTALWALDRAGERSAFEQLMRFIADRRARHPLMHVYHYNHYEATALKRLAGRHATCADELDALLRGRVLVDLFKAVRQGLRASVESYSLKRVEPLYGFVRAVPLRDANACLAAFEAWLELRDTSSQDDELRDAIQGYNRDDCLSTMHLRAWLEDRRMELEERGMAIARPAPLPGDPSAGLAEQVDRVRATMRVLLDGVPAEFEQRDVEQNARFVLAHLLDWHRREDKSAWWEYYRLCDLSDDELQEDKTSIGSVTYEGVAGKEKRSLVHRYRFPPQDHTLDRALTIHDPRTRASAGMLVSIDDSEGIIELKRGATSSVPHPTSLIPHDLLKSDELRDSLLRLGEDVSARGWAASGPFSAAIALLRRAAPPLGPHGPTAHATAIADALAIDGSVLPVQGPPGTGKTHLAAEMIVALVRAGKRVGITANSHKVIANVLDRVCTVARAAGAPVRAIQRIQKGDEDVGSRDPFVRLVTANEEVVSELAAGQANVVAGTAWLWSRAEMSRGVDVLFVDEAGQMSLANVLAAAPAANSLVLLGDPQQLDQPQTGVHPPGVAVSALGHVLGARATLAAGQGIFLEETWRMHPDVCTFISEVFYEGRLRSKAGLSRMRFDAAAPVGGTGLRFVPVAHRGNRSESVEEAEVVARLARKLASEGSTWTDKHGDVHPMGLDDVMIVAPYNAHVALIRKSLPGARVGTVDKFQGREAPVVIYSMATSSPEDAPRGAEFLYSGNRLNVAVSRGRCAAFLVANPALFEMRCKSERQMALVNAFCRYLELAVRVPNI